MTLEPSPHAESLSRQIVFLHSGNRDLHVQNRPQLILAPNFVCKRKQKDPHMLMLLLVMLTPIGTGYQAVFAPNHPIIKNKNKNKSRGKRKKKLVNMVVKQ